MFKILSSTVLNVTTPISPSEQMQCRGDDISQVSLPAWSESRAYSKPAPALSCQTPSSAKTLSSNLLPANFTWISSSHWEKPVQTSGKHLSQQWELHFSCSANSPCLCFIPLQESQVCVSDTENEKLLILTFFSRLGVLVNPYPFGMVLTVNQNRKISPKREFCLPSQQDLTHPHE